MPEQKLPEVSSVEYDLNKSLEREKVFMDALKEINIYTKQVIDLIRNINQSINKAL